MIKHRKILAGILLQLLFLTISIISPHAVSAITVDNPFTDTTLYIDRDSQSYRKYQQLLQDKPEEAAILSKIATTPQAAWFSGSSTSIKASVDAYITKASSSNAVPVLVLYNIPQRDCQGYSAGGTLSAEEYRSWINELALGIGNRRAVLLFEPDGLGLLNCLSADDKAARLSLYRHAMDIFAQNPNIITYIDASMWVAPKEMAVLLKQAGITNARGVVVNVSGYETSETSANYINAVKTELGLSIYGLIDTSRNGVGPDATGEWCNPAGRALGTRPGIVTNSEIVDANLWVKRPGESDGQCNGGPAAGLWWQEYALRLINQAVNLEEQVPLLPIPIEVTSPEVLSPPVEVTTPAPTQPQTPTLTTSPSTLKIYAAGTVAAGSYPDLELLINGLLVKKYPSIAGKPMNREFIELSYTQSEKILPEQVKLQFSNDAATATEDRNLMIDKIVIDDTVYQTEAISTTSVGSWNALAGCNLGTKQSEWLHCNGYFKYQSTSEVQPATTALTSLLNPLPAAITGSEYKAEYFNNRRLSGTPVLVRSETQVQYDWGNGSPAPEVPSDNFSARWSKTQEFAEGIYTFTMTADDGVRVLLDKEVLIDHWKDQAPTTSIVSVPVSAGSHKITIEYYENGGGATAKFAMSAAPQRLADSYTAEYFNSKNLQGSPVLLRSEDAINYDWQNNAPAPGISADNFSVRWRKTVTLAAGSYRFSMTGDDGYRVKLDGTEILSRWQDQAVTTTARIVQIPVGEHEIVVEYYENYGRSIAEFQYEKVE
ncbi:MAG: glycoside hydrolase family 6 protein [bacterium]|nr:glycoside hydrolase family 6 protein [bacterium]